MLHHLYQLCFCFLKQAGVKQGCTFYFLMMSRWLILYKRISLNMITSKTTLIILDQSDIQFSRAVKSSADFVEWHTTNYFFKLEVLFCCCSKLLLVLKETVVQNTTFLLYHHYKHQSLLMHNLLGSIFNWFMGFMGFNGTHLSDLWWVQLSLSQIFWTSLIHS